MFMLLSYFDFVKNDAVTKMALSRSSRKSQLAVKCVKCRYFLMEQVTMVFPLLNRGNNAQGIYIYSFYIGDEDKSHSTKRL